MIRHTLFQSRALPVLCLMLFALALGAAAAEPEDVQITTQIFRIRGNISGDTSLTDNIWAGQAPKGEEGKSMNFFNSAKLSVAGHRLSVNESGWRWDDKPMVLGAGLPAPEPNVMAIATPRLIARLGQNAAIDISTKQVIEYFAPHGDGLYELKLSQLVTGLSLTTMPRQGRAGRIHLSGLTLTSRMVEKRKALAGTSLNVGEPEVNTRTLTADVELKIGKDYGFFFFTNDGQGTLLVRLRVEAAPPADKSSKQ